LKGEGKSGGKFSIAKDPVKNPLHLKKQPKKAINGGVWTPNIARGPLVMGLKKNWVPVQGGNPLGGKKPPTNGPQEQFVKDKFRG